jgi:FKBP-type peptidyl-prolyl cis-trans isomerase FklB
MQRMQKLQANELAAAGERFLEQNAKRPEVVTTESGLQYEVLQEGTGRRPTRDDTVRVHYHGTLVDGTVFDSSVERGESIEFGVSGVISGWTEALQLMQEGARYKLFIPQQLAYGASGAGGAIAPYSTLVFEVELLAVR